jgi:hypothetical protein
MWVYQKIQITHNQFRNIQKLIYMKERYSISSIIDRFQSIMQKLKIPSKIIFFTVGFLSTIWFLIRVIPKPQRATYPCVRAAAPLASAFVVYLAGLSVALLSFKKFKSNFASARYAVAGLFLLVGLTVSFVIIPLNQGEVYSATADDTPLEPANQPVGMAVGIFPGRVVWVMDTAATNQSCDNSFGNAYFLDKNTNQAVVDEMVEDAFLKLTGEANINNAWEAVFEFHNQKRGKGAVGYTAGEKVFLKINRTSSWGGNYSTSDLSRANNSNYAISETSPQVVTSVLRNLVNVVGVPQENIYVGDPMKHIYKDDYDKWHGEFPDVHYLDISYTTLGREIVTASTTAIVDYSDNNSVLSVGTDNLYTIFEEMEYMINLPTMKGHVRAGVTMFAKNHFGSHTRGDASHLHDGLMQANNGSMRTNYEMYRVLVDLMSHKLLGEKNLIYLMDALYSSDFEIDKPDKFQKSPWNNDWSSSIFISQDPVAIESVGFDVLYYEFDGTNGLQSYPHYGAVDDYLHQAADSANWPDGIKYDPDNDGVYIASLGVHEHWNNTADMKYSRNLGTGSGIELIKLIKPSDEILTEITVDNSDLPSNQVNAIYVDSSNVKWIGTDLGLARFIDNTWTIYTTSDHLLNNKVNDIAYELTAYGKELWIATDSGLTVAAYNVDGVTSATTYVDANSGLVDNKVNAVCVDVLHNRWIGTDSAISVFKGSIWDSLLTADDPNGEPFNLSEFKVTDFAAYNFDSMAFASTAGKGILRFENDEVDGITGASTYGQPWSAINSNNIQAIDIKGELQWFGTDVGAYLHPNKLTKGDWFLYNTDSGLVSNNVKAVHIDKNDNIWLGTSEGLSIYNGLNWYKYTTAEGLINNNINCITSDLEGNVWVGTSGGIQWFNIIPGVIVDNPTLINDPKFELVNNIYIFPNPVTDDLFLKTNLDMPQNIRVMIYSINGKLIDIPINEFINSKVEVLSIDVSDSRKYSNGIYIVNIKGDTFQQIVKIIKQ